MNKVPFLDLRAPYIELKTEIDEAISRVVNSGWFIGGKEVEKFEDQFAKYCGVRNCVGVANGLDALTLALRALGVGSGDEVIVPSNTYIATWLAVSHCNAIPVPVDPDPLTHNIDPTKIEAAITSKTKAILPVHLYGQPADLKAVLRIAEKNNLFVLEDGAQSHGATYNGQRIGGHGNAVAWSFYPGKNLGAMGDAGGITTNDDALADRLRVLRNYGSRVKYQNEVIGFNSRLDPLQAAILSVKLKSLDEWNTRRSRIANRYLRELRTPSLSLPTVPSNVNPVWHLFVLRHPERDKFQKSLMDHGIDTLIHYPIAPHSQAAYRDSSEHVRASALAEKLASEVISLPIGPHMSDQAVQTVIDVTNSLA